MAKDNRPNSTSSNEPPGEVRSNLQVVVRVVLAIVVLALLVGLGFALVRLLSRPDALDAALSTPLNVAALHAAYLLGTG